MARRLVVDGTNRIGAIRQGSIRVTGTAHQGESGEGGWDLDDDAAALLFPGLKVSSLIEDASGGDKTLWRGRISTKDLSRGDMPVGNARQFGISAVDSNWDLSKLRVHQWSRPAETDRARVIALLAYILNGSSSTVTNARKRATSVIAATYAPNTNTVSMPARVYDATDPFGVLDDCARAAGKDFFVIVEDNGTLSLFYDLPTSTAYASTLAIRDDTANLTTIFPPIPEGAVGTQDASEFVSGAGLVYSTGAIVTDFNAGFEAANDVAEVTTYDSGATAPADASARLAAFLASRGIEEERFRCAVQLLPAEAHLIKAGMTLQFRSAAAGVLAATTLRVARCELEISSPGIYTLHLELGFPEKIAPRIVDAGRVAIVAGGNPIYGSGASDTEFFVTFRVYLTELSDVRLVAVWEGVAWAGVLFQKGQVGHSGTDTFQGFVLPETTPTGLLITDPISTPAWHVVTIGLTGTTRYVTLDGVLNTISAVGSEWPPYTGTSGAAAGTVGIWVWNNNGIPGDATQRLEIDSITGSNVIDSFNRVEASDWGPDWTVLGSPPFTLNVDGSVGTIEGATNYVRRIVSTVEVGPGSVAYTGHEYGPVLIAMADGATADWTFPYPFVPGTLMVYVDNILQNATEDDPATGDFSISWMPGAGDQISAEARLLQ